MKNNVKTYPKLDKEGWSWLELVEFYEKRTGWIEAFEAELRQLKQQRCGNVECDHDCPICFDEILGVEGGG